MGRFALLLVLLAGQILLASRARAENVVLVLDGGAGAKEKAAENWTLATTLSQRLKERGDTVRVYLVSVLTNGKPRVDELTPGSDAFPAGFDQEFEGRSDARVALAAALRGPALKEPVTVVLIGAFGKVDPAPEGASQAVDAWKKSAPDGSQVIPLGLSEPARKSLESAKGWRASGVLVLGLKDVKVETQSWSAFDIDPPLRANIRAEIDSIPWGDGPFAAPAIAALGTDGDTFTGDGKGGLLLTRARTSGDETTLRLLLAPDSAAWNLAATGTPIPVRWVPTPEIRWLEPAGGQPSFVALDLERGVPREATYRYRRSVHPLHPHLGRPPKKWSLSEQLRVRAGPERAAGLALVEGEVVATATVQAAGHLDEEGSGAWGPEELQTSDKGAEPLKWDAPIAVDFHLRTAPGRVRVRLTEHSEPQALPAASADRPWEVALLAENRNASESVSLTWRAVPLGSADSLTLRVRRGDSEEEAWPAGARRSFAVGATYRVRPVAAEGLLPPAHGSVALVAFLDWPQEVAVEGEGRWRVRKPQLVVEDGDVRYRADAKDVAEEKPLRLRLDADGGDGTWLAELLERAPTVVKRQGGPQEFALAPLAPGRWELRRASAWSGERAGIFEDREERVPAMAVWPAGGQAWQWEVPVTVPARWGRMGWVLVALAALAALLGVFVVLSHRALPITGTLLYTVEGRTGAVGRLALAPVGRRAATVTADERGRLALGSPGTALIRLLPTRVGGMAEVPVPAGGTERRLLVDGLSFSVGRHALRYVQPGGQESAPRAGEASVPVPGAPQGTGAGSTPAPDLLGPEYDLPHGA